MSSIEEVFASSESGSHYCLSGNPACSGIRPCDQCFAHLEQRILPHAMWLTGGPFIQSREQSLSFIAAWRQAFIESVNGLVFEERIREGQAAESLLSSSEDANDASASDRDTERATEAAEALRGLLEAMSREDLSEIRDSLANGTFPGQEALTEEEMRVFDEVFIEAFTDASGEKEILVATEEATSVPAAESTADAGEKEITVKAVTRKQRKKK